MSNLKKILASIISITLIILFVMNGVSFAASEYEPNDSFSSATSISDSGDTSGTIGYSGDYDYFRFTPTVSGSYTMETVGSIDSYGYLYNSSQSLLTSDDDAGVDYNFSISYTLTANQTYYIMVRHYSSSGTGSYTLRITKPGASDDYGNDFSSAMTIQIGSDTQGSINYGGDIDCFKFTATTTGNYVVETTGSTDTYGYLYNSSQTQIGYDDDSGDGSNFRIESSLTANQIYYVKVKHYSSTGTGSYTLKVMPYKELSVVQYTQQPYNQLCWATSASMVISYFLGDTTNRNVQIAENLYGSTDPAVFNQPADVSNGKTYVESYCSNKQGTTVYSSLSSSTVTSNINNSFPIYTRIGWKSGGGHMHVIKGYYVDNGVTYVIYNDPWDGQEYTTTYSNYVSNDQWTWTHCVTYTNK